MDVPARPEVRLLGGFSILQGKKELALTSRAAQSLFAFLMLNAGTSYRREKLAGMLWPDSTEEAARDYLRHALWRIRKVLVEAGAAQPLKADDLTIGMEAAGEIELDVRRLKSAGQARDADGLMAALAGNGGELLPGFYEEWVVLEREHIRAVYEREMERLLGLLQEQGRWAAVLEWAEEWIASGQRPEPAYRALMLAHAANGDMSKVAAAYERCEKTLQDFGVEPSQQTRELYEDIKAGRRIETRAAPAPARREGQDSPAPGFPVPLTSFIGRRSELKKIVGLLAANRLVTLVGAGGVGKTRLAIQAALSAREHFPDGLYWVELAPLSDPGLVPQAIATGLGVHQSPNQDVAAAIGGTVGQRKLLLVLDNCEHLVEACARWAELLLSSAPNLSILATGREGLATFSETAWPVSPLSVPAGSGGKLADLKAYESIALFSERARKVAPEFELNESNAEAIAKICQRLDGMPLALELAAARVKMLTPGEIASRLDERFSLLAAGSRTAAERHQTLRATLDWSHDLLTEAERIVFRRLAVFAGSFSASAAENVAGDPAFSVLDLLGHLINKSLVNVLERGTEAEKETRYVLLETVREYARQKLVEAGEDSAIYERHLRFFLQLTEAAEPELERSRQRYWLDRLEPDVDNFRLAQTWAVEMGQSELGLRLAGSLRRFWFQHHHMEGVKRLSELLAAPSAAGPTAGRLKALNALLFMHWPSGEVEAAGISPVIEEALSLGHKLQDPRNLAYALLWAGLNETALGNYDLARAHLEQSRQLWLEFRDETYTAFAHVFLGDVDLFDGNRARARVYFEKSVQPLREVGDIAVLAIPLRRLGQIAILDGDLNGARAHLLESLECNWEIRDYRGTGASLAALGALGLAEGDTERAVQLFGVVDRLVDMIRTPLLLFDRLEFGRNLELARVRMRQPAFSKAWEQGRLMPLEAAVSFGRRVARPKAGRQTAG